MRSVYDEENGFRTYPDNPAYGFVWGREITAETIFDEVQIDCIPSAHIIGRATLRNAGANVTRVPAEHLQDWLRGT